MPETTISIVLPLPPRECSPNSHIHWARKSKATRKYKQDCWAIALQRTLVMGTPPPRMGSCRVDADFKFSVRRVRDDDNLWASLKPAFDACVVGEIMTDDRWMSLGGLTQAIDKENPGVRLTFTSTARGAEDAPDTSGREGGSLAPGKEESHQEAFSAPQSELDQYDD